MNNQRDSRWANIPVGTGNQTIGQVGCTISVIGNIVGLTPDVVNERIKAVGGFAQQNLVDWSRLHLAFPEFNFKRVWVYNNDEVLANVPNVIVESPAIAIGGRGSHWTQYIGNHQLNDPWTGLIRSTSDFPNPTGYCVITKIPQAPPIVIELQGVDAEIGFKPTEEGQVIQRGDKTWKAFLQEGNLVWIAQLPQDPTVSVQTNPTPENVTTTTETPIISVEIKQKSLLDKIIDFIFSFWR